MLAQPSKKVCFVQDVFIHQNYPQLCNQDLSNDLLNCSLVPQSILTNSDDDSHIIAQKKKVRNQKMSAILFLVLCLFFFSIFLIFEDFIRSRTDNNACNQSFTTLITKSIQNFFPFLTDVITGNE
jgi:hypothetical protein